MVYKKSGYAGVFGLGFAILALDFIMRILIIEKKVAKRYDAEDSEEPNGHPEEQENANEDGHEDGEEEPLIRKEESDAYKVPPQQPKAVRSFPILYCLKDARLLTALLLAFVQATL